MGFSEKLYHHSPIWLQNLLISAYGFKIKHQRYNKVYRDHLNFLLNTEHYSTKQLAELQTRYLAKLINSAYKHVPYYHSLLSEQTISPNEISLDNLAEAFPITSKDTLRTQTRSFYSDAYSTNNATYIHTSGTTGTPLKILASKQATSKNYAFFARQLRWAGVNLGERSATFAGRIIIPDSQNQPPYWRHHVALNNILCSSYHIADNTIPAYIRALERHKPIYIDSYPSAIFAIARFIIENNYTHKIKPTAVITSSETLLDDQRRTIEQAFSCPVYDHFGNAEMAAFITQCEQGKYHINSEYGLIEIVDENNKPVPVGQAGKIICTGFLNDAMPLIRYDIGDQGILSDQSCSCGRKHPVMESILGRVDDMIITKSGRYVGRLDPVFKGLSGIKETQIVQTAIDQITINIVKGEAYSSTVADNLVAELKKRIGEDMLFEIKHLEEIPRTKSGKFRSVVSNIR